MAYILAMLITAVIETTFFWSVGYRTRKFLAYVFGVNLFTNLLVNLAFHAWYAGFPWHIYILVAGLETGVLLSEFYLIGLYGKKWTAKLFGLVLFANLLSYGTGIVLQFFGLL